MAPDNYRTRLCYRHLFRRVSACCGPIEQGTGRYLGIYPEPKSEQQVRKQSGSVFWTYFTSQDLTAILRISPVSYSASLVSSRPRQESDFAPTLSSAGRDVIP